MSANFLQYSGGSNGYLIAPLSVLTTEINALASGSSATSSVVGNLTQSNFGSGIWGVADFVSGGTITPAAGGYLALWFLFSPDGGSTFELTASNTDLPRQPDITIPLLTSYAVGNIAQSSGIFRMPWWTSKVYIVNHSSVALAATGNIVKIGSVAIQY